MHRAVLLILLLLTIIARHGAAQEITVQPFKAYDDLPTTPALLVKFKATGEERFNAVAPEAVADQIFRAKEIHEMGARAYLAAAHALKTKDRNLIPFEGAGMGGAGEPSPGGQGNGPRGEEQRLKRYRLITAGLPELRVRVNDSGKIVYIAVNMATGTYDVRRHYYYATDGTTCRIMAMGAQSADAFTRFWFLRPDQTLLGTVRFDAGDTLVGTVLEWDENGELTQAVGLSGGAYLFDNPFLR